MVDVEGLKTALLVTVSTPVKPGSIHRFLETPEFERRLAEAVIVMDFIPRAFERGVDVANGKISARALGLGSALSTLYRRVLERADVRPVYGLSASALVLSAVSGYLSQQGRRIRDGLRQALTALIYRSPGDDTAAFVEGLEATGASELVSRLEAEGITKRTIRLEDVPLGSVFEKLEAVDQGFSLNVRGYVRALDLARAAAKGKSLAASALAAYLEAIDSLGFKVQASSLKGLLDADREVRRKARLDGLLGLVYTAVVLVLDENPGLPVA